MSSLREAIRELWQFMRHRKMYWLVPILITVGLIAVLLAVADSPVAPFLYPF
jgi:Family of unknown function (DUF5989)